MSIADWIMTKHTNGTSPFLHISATCDGATALSYRVERTTKAVQLSKSILADLFKLLASQTHSEFLQAEVAEVFTKPELVKRKLPKSSPLGEQQLSEEIDGLDDLYNTAVLPSSEKKRPAKRSNPTLPSVSDMPRTAGKPADQEASAPTCDSESQAPLSPKTKASWADTVKLASGDSRKPSFHTTPFPVCTNPVLLQRRIEEHAEAAEDMASKMSKLLAEANQLKLEVSIITLERDLLRKRLNEIESLPPPQNLFEVTNPPIPPQDSPPISPRRPSEKRDDPSTPEAPQTPSTEWKLVKKTRRSPSESTIRSADSTEMQIDSLNPVVHPPGDPPASPPPIRPTTGET
jgi:hypothetical protein